MTRNYIFLFLCTTIIIISLIEGLFGHQGVIVNTHLNQEVAVQQKKLDIATLELNNLEFRLAHMWDVDTILDNARAMGFAKQGETVYYFIDNNDNPLQEIPTEVVASTRIPVSTVTKFDGISRVVSIVIGLVVGGCATVLYNIRQRRRLENRQHPRGYEWPV